MVSGLETRFKRLQEEKDKNKEEKATQNKLEFLKWNYEQCQAGYHSRDQMTNDIFFKMLQVFLLYLGLLSLSFLTRLPNTSLKDFLNQLSSDFLSISLKWWYLGYVVFIAITGFLSLSAMLLILYNMINCKIALRKQCTFIEEKIHNRYIQEIGKSVNGLNCSYYDFGKKDINDENENIKIRRKTISNRNKGVEVKKKITNDRNNIKDNCFMKRYTKTLIKDCKHGFPDDLDKKFNQHWECICKREGIFKSTSDEEKGYIILAGLFILGFWVAICLAFLYFIWQL